MSAKAAGSAPVIQVCAPRVGERVVKRGAAARDRDGRRSRRAASSGAKPVISLISPACASTRRISSAFCSPVEASAAGTPLPAWVTLRSVRCGPSSVRPAAASRARLSCSTGGSGPRSRPRCAAAAAAPSSRRARYRRCGNPGALSRAAASAPASRATVSARAAATATATSAVSCSMASSQWRSLVASSNSRLRERKERSSALTRLECGGIHRQHQTVEKAPALGGRAVEQRVHGRHQPHHAQMVGEGGGRADRLAVDAAAARRRGVIAVPADRCRCRAWQARACPRSRH